MPIIVIYSALIECFLQGVALCVFMKENIVFKPVIMNTQKMLKLTLSTCLMWIMTMVVQAQSAYPMDVVKRLQDKRRSRQEQIAKPRPGNVQITATGVPTLYGSIYEAEDIKYAGGIYSFEPNGGCEFKNVAKHDRLWCLAGTYANGKYYSIHVPETPFGKLPSEFNFSIFDAETWQEEKHISNSDWSGVATDLSYDPSSGKIYGCFYSPTAYGVADAKILGTLNIETGKPAVIGTMPVHMVAMACNKEGKLYGVGDDAKLYTINKETAEVTLIGDTYLFAIPFYQSATFDYDSGVLYFTGFINDYGDKGIASINTQTGMATVLVDLYENGMNEQITGLFIKQDAGAVVVAPGAATDLKFISVEAQLQGDITFKMPIKDSQSNTIVQQLKYTVKANGKVKVEGRAAAGEVVKRRILVDEAGMCDFVVDVAFAEGESGESSSSITQWVGQDHPCPVENVGLSAEGNTLSLFWSPSNKSVHGGYLGKQTFKIVRYPDNKVVSEGKSEREFIELIENSLKCSYSYDIIAVAGGKESDAVRSNEVTLGSVIGTLPYHNNFSYQEDFEEFSVIDANKDGSTWKYDAQMKSAAYTYNDKNAADDWLITPGISLEAHKMYKFSFKAYNSYPDEKVSVSIGKVPTVEGMNRQILDVYTITYEPREHQIHANVVLKEDGIYYFGIKACSDADMSTMYVDDVEISAIPGNAPAQVEQLMVIPGEQGKLEATISFDVPDKCIDGSKLTSIQEFVIRRNDQIINRVKHTGSKTVSYFDNSIVDNGEYKYVVAAVNENGEGAESICTKYIGVDVPGAVENFNVVEDLNEEGTLVLTWDAPLKGQHGGFIDPSKLTYFISSGMSPEAFSNGSSTTYRDKLDVSRGQTYQGYSVYADNEIGSGRNVWQTKVAVAGPAIIAPYYDSFSGVHFNGPWLTNVVEGTIDDVSWIVLDGELLLSGTHDNDGGVLSFSTTALNKSGRIESPKIDIRDVKDVKLIFWVYLSGTNDKMDVQVSVEHAAFETVKSIVMNEGSGWKRYEVSLDAYAGKRFIQIGFLGTSVETTEQIISLDNISIKTQLRKDLEIMSCEIKDTQVKVGETCGIDLKLRNSGSIDVKGSDYTIELYKNGALANTFKGLDLPIDERVECQLDDKITVADKEDTNYYVVVKYDGDENLDNNQTSKIMIHVILSNYPVVTDLIGKPGMNHVSLSWSDPDMNSMQADPITDHFEDYRPFAINNYGDWKVYDGDGANTIKITLNMESGPLEYPNAGKPMAFQVFNVDESGIPFASWEPHSGVQMLCAFKCTAKGKTPRNDDWLISPKLNGNAQKISFFAKAGMAAQYEDGSMTIPEELEVYYSTTTDDVKAFKKLGETVEITEVKKWEEVRVELPQGTKYFAIRCISDNKFVLMLDDFTFIPDGAVIEDISLEGYNVYKNGQKITNELIGEAYFEDCNVEEGKEYTYNVTACYDKGESMFSNGFTIVFTPSSIDENVMCTVLVYAKDDHIQIEGADHVDVSVFTLSGHCLFHELVNGSAAVPVSEGVYLVKVGNQVNKILVR